MTMLHRAALSGPDSTATGAKSRETVDVTREPQNSATLLATEEKAFSFHLPFLHSKGPALYVQRMKYSLSLSGPLHVAEQVKAQPYLKDPWEATVPSVFTMV